MSPTAVQRAVGTGRHRRLTASLGGPLRDMGAAWERTLRPACSCRRHRSESFPGIARDIRLSGPVVAERAQPGGVRMAGDSCEGDASAGIRVLLVDDHPLVRRTLAEALSDEDDLTVVGECEDGSQVLEAATRLRPDVVFMDLSMKVMDGLAATG